MIDLLGRVLAIATGLSLWEAWVHEGSWWHVLVLFLAALVVTFVAVWIEDEH